MKRMRALVQKEIFEKSSNIPFLLKWFPMPETNHFLPWAFQKCHVVRKWFPFGNDFFGNHFHLEMIFLNDLLPQKMISGCFLRKKKWFTGAKNHFLPVQKWFFTQENDFEATQKWFSWNDFWNILCRFWRCDLLLRKKTFPSEMGISGNEWKSFFSRKCSTTSQLWNENMMLKKKVNWQNKFRCAKKKPLFWSCSGSFIFI